MQGFVRKNILTFLLMFLSADIALLVQGIYYEAKLKTLRQLGRDYKNQYLALSQKEETPEFEDQTDSLDVIPNNMQTAIQVKTPTPIPTKKPSNNLSNATYKTPTPTQIIYVTSTFTPTPYSETATSPTVTPTVNQYLTPTSAKTSTSTPTPKPTNSPTPKPTSTPMPAGGTCKFILNGQVYVNTFIGTQCSKVDKTGYFCVSKSSDCTVSNCMTKAITEAQAGVNRCGASYGATYKSSSFTCDAKFESGSCLTPTPETTCQNKSC